MKYARIEGGYLVDVWRVPEDFPTTEVRDKALGPEGWVEVPDDATHGAKDNGDGSYANPIEPERHSAEPEQDVILQRLDSLEAKIDALAEAMVSDNVEG